MTITPPYLDHMAARLLLSRRIILATLRAIPLRRVRRIHRAAQRGQVPYTDATKCLGYRCLPWHKRLWWIAAPLDRELELAYLWLPAIETERDRQRELLRLTETVLAERESG